MNWIIKKTYEPVKKNLIQRNKKIFDFYLPLNISLKKIKNLISLSFPGYPEPNNIIVTSPSYDNIPEIVNKEKRVLCDYLEIKVLSDNTEVCFSKKEKLFGFKKKKEQFLLKERKKIIKFFKKNNKNSNPYTLYTFEEFMKSSFDIQKKKYSEKKHVIYLLNLCNKFRQFLTYFFKYKENHKNNKMIFIGILIISIIISKKHSKSFLLILWNYFFVSNFFKICNYIKNKIIEYFGMKKINNSGTYPCIFLTELLNIQIFLAGVIRSSNLFAI